MERQLRHALSRESRCGRTRAGQYRYRHVHASACRPCRLEHTAWNSGRWLPTFPNAALPDEPARDRLARGGRGAAPQADHGSYQDSVLPVLDAGMVQAVQAGDEIFDGARLSSTWRAMRRAKSASGSQPARRSNLCCFAGMPSTARCRSFTRNGRVVSATIALKRYILAGRSSNAAASEALSPLPKPPAREPACVSPRKRMLLFRPSSRKLRQVTLL